MSLTSSIFIGTAIVFVLACMVVRIAVDALLKTPEEKSDGQIINKIGKAIGNDKNRKTKN